jgi:aspartate/glutamate racemase
VAKTLGLIGGTVGGTELPLLLRDEEHNGMPLLDTTRIHLELLIAEMFS